MGLRHKLLLLWLILLLFPLAVLSGIGYFYIDSNLREDATHNLQQVIATRKDAVASYFDRLLFLTHYFAGNPLVRDVVTAPRGNDSNAQQTTARTVIREMMGTYPSIVEFQLIRGDDFEQPTLVESRRVNKQPLVLDQVLRELQSEHNNTPSLIYFPQPGQRGYLISAVALRNTAGNGNHDDHLGYLAMITDLETLDNIVDPGTNVTSQFFIAYDQGSLLTQNNALPFTRLNIDLTKNVASSNSNTVLSNYKINGDSYTLSLTPLKGTFWLGAITDNRFVLEKKEPYIIIFVMAVSLMLLLLGGVFNATVAKVAIKPIHALIQATQQIAKGDFKPELNITSKDELGDLALAFRHMGKQLSHSSRRIRQLAYYDPLTQLPNRTTLRETLNRLLMQSKRNKWKTAVLFIDLDDFKKVNDRLGHSAGDELLVQISERLKNRLRQSDMLFDQSAGPSVDQLISRRGGDEFNAILSSIKAPHDAAVVAERIIQDLNEPFNIASSEIHVGASVGIAIFPDDGGDADTLLRNADLAMYEAKAKGKNNYHIFTSAINKQVHQRLALESALQSALVQGQFRLYYQPKVRLEDMKTVGFEALIRWYEPKKGVILPSSFIPVAEESNLIRDIGNWILGESMQQVQLWESVLPDGVRIAINISARQLAQADLVDQFQTMMEHFGLSARRLEIELTETSVLQDEVMASQHLTDLRALGVEISLDDFGTGYSSLNFLRKLPIDTVKIDRTFTAAVTRSGETRAIVISLLNLCRQLNVKSIAEGIETTDQLQFMLEHGCDQGQGFLFSEPLPANEVMVFLEEPSFLALAPEV